MDRAELNHQFDHRPLSIDGPVSMPTPNGQFNKTNYNTDSVTKWVDVNTKNHDIITS